MVGDDSVSERFGRSSSLVLHYINIWLNKIKTLWTQAEKQMIQILKSAKQYYFSVREE